MRVSTDTCLYFWSLIPGRGENFSLLSLVSYINNRIQDPRSVLFKEAGPSDIVKQII